MMWFTTVFLLPFVEWMSIEYVGVCWRFWIIELALCWGNLPTYTYRISSFWHLLLGVFLGQCGTWNFTFQNQCRLTTVFSSENSVGLFKPEISSQSVFDRQGSMLWKVINSYFLYQIINQNLGHLGNTVGFAHSMFVYSCSVEFPYLLTTEGVQSCNHLVVSLSVSLVPFSNLWELYWPYWILTLSANKVPMRTSQICFIFHWVNVILFTLKSLQILHFSNIITFSIQ